MKIRNRMLFFDRDDSGGGGAEPQEPEGPASGSMIERMLAEDWAGEESGEDVGLDDDMTLSEQQLARGEKQPPEEETGQEEAGQEEQPSEEEQEEEGEEEEEKEGAEQEEEGEGEADEEEEFDELAAAREREAVLLKQMEEWRSRPQPTEAQPQLQEGAGAGEAAEGKGPERSVIPFVASEEELNEVLTTPDGMNRLASSIYYTAEQQLVRRVVPIIQSQISMYSTMDTAQREFYERNKDLRPYRSYVGMLVEKVASENPEYAKDPIGKLEGIMKDVEKRARAELKLGGKGARRAGKRPTGKRPGFAKGSGARKRRADTRSAEQREIDEL